MNPKSNIQNPKWKSERAWTCAIAAAFCIAASGCQSAYFFNSERKQKFAAECDKLAGQRVAIAVWADPSTLDMDAQAAYRTAEKIEYFLRMSGAKKELKGMTLIDSRKVVEAQERLGNAGATLANSEIAKKVGADVLLRVDLYEYTTRAPEANGLVLGRVGGNVTVQRADEPEPLYRTEIAASFPEDSKLGVLDRTDDEVLNETLQRFGDAVARKFYAHEENYK